MSGVTAIVNDENLLGLWNSHCAGESHASYLFNMIVPHVFDTAVLMFSSGWLLFAMAVVRFFCGGRLFYV